MLLSFFFVFLVREQFYLLRILSLLDFDLFKKKIVVVVTVARYVNLTNIFCLDDVRNKKRKEK